MFKTLISLIISLLLMSHISFEHVVYAQEWGDEEVDLSCKDVSNVCYNTPTDIAQYTKIMQNIINILKSIPAVEDTAWLGDDTITSKTIAEEVNFDSLMTEFNKTFFDWNGVFDDYHFLDAGSSTLKRDKDKINGIYSRLVETSIDILDKNLSKEIVPEEVYKRIDKELQKLWYIRLGKAWGADDYNMTRSKQNYSTLIKILIQLNQMYKQMYQEKFWTDSFEDLGSTTYDSYTSAGDTTADEIDNEKIRYLRDQVHELEVSQFVTAFDTIKNDSTPESEFVTIETDKLLGIVRNLENQYRCTHGKQNVCSDGTKNIREWFTDLYENEIKKDTNKSIDVIKTATSRLKGALFGGSDDDKAAAKQRKEALVAWYGANKDRPRSWATSLSQIGRQLANGVRSNIDKVTWRDGVKRSSQQAQNLDQWDGTVSHEENYKYTWTKEKEDFIASIKEEKEAEEVLPGAGLINNLNANQARIANYRVQKIRNTFDTYAVTKKNAWTNDLIYLDVQEMTKQAVWLSVNVHATANRLGDYDEKEKINYTLAKMCEEQCSNLPNKKCRLE